jgi:copper chaperone NosL
MTRRIRIPGAPLSAGRFPQRFLHLAGWSPDKDPKLPAGPGRAIRAAARSASGLKKAARPGPKTAILTALVVLGTWLASGCSHAPDWPPQPSELRLGEESCAECRMIASDARYAAQSIGRDGSVQFFDDLGCLLAHRHGAAQDPQGVFALTGEAGRWVRGDQAWVVQSADFPSPMGYGLVAFASHAEARAEAARHAGATVMPLSNLLREGAPVPAGRQSTGSDDSGTP